MAPRLIVLLSVLTLAACATRPEQPLRQENTPVEGELLGVRYEYPADWFVEQSETMADITIAGPTEGDDQPALSIHVVHDDLGRTFDKHVSDMVDRFVARGALVERQRFLTHRRGFDYAWVELHWTVDGVEWRDWLIVVPHTSETRFLAMVGAPPSIWHKYENVFLHFVDSISIANGDSAEHSRRLGAKDH